MIKIKFGEKGRSKTLMDSEKSIKETFEFYDTPAEAIVPKKDKDLQFDEGKEFTYIRRGVIDLVNFRDTYIMRNIIISRMTIFM
jgi:hypothetical protein